MNIVKKKDGFLFVGEIDGTNCHENITLVEAIKTRRTCRAYSSDKVNEETLSNILSLSMNAASACNEQKWNFINIEDKELLNELYLRGSGAFLTKTNQAVLILYDNSTVNKKYSDHMQSGASFISYFMLVAHSYGVGTCWVCHLPRKAELRRLFNFPKNLDPVALVTYGKYRGRIRERQIKYNLESNLFTNKFVQHSAKPLSNLIVKRLLMEIYYLLPPIIRKSLRKYSFSYEKKFYNHVD